MYFAGSWANGFKIKIVSSFILIKGRMAFFKPVKTKKRSKRYDKISHR